MQMIHGQTHLEFLPLLNFLLQASLVVCNLGFHTLQQCQQLLPGSSRANVSRWRPACQHPAGELWGEWGAFLSELGFTKEKKTLGRGQKQYIVGNF